MNNVWRRFETGPFLLNLESVVWYTKISLQGRGLCPAVELSKIDHDEGNNYTLI